MTGFLWVIDLIMLIMSVFLLMGKGSGLIAGYNTASEKEKLKYDEKKLCRTMGVGLFVLTIILAVLLFFNFKFSSRITEYIFIGITVIDISMMIILGSTICKRK